MSPMSLELAAIEARDSAASRQSCIGPTDGSDDRRRETRPRPPVSAVLPERDSCRIKQQVPNHNQPTKDWSRDMSWSGASPSIETGEARTTRGRNMTDNTDSTTLLEFTDEDGDQDDVAELEARVEQLEDALESTTDRIIDVIDRLEEQTADESGDGSDADSKPTHTDVRGFQ